MPACRLSVEAYLDEFTDCSQAIRRSLKGDKEQRSHHQSHNSIGPKSASAIVPPRKVIKALYDYEPQNKNGQELGFRKGDFFHVISRENDTEWYEACNPLNDARGLVPVAFFEVIGKHQRQSGNSISSSGGHDSGFSEKGISTMPPPTQPAANMQNMHTRGPSGARNPGAMVYGIVKYDFDAERPDELEAKSGEAIIVVAQSNPEWFVAKPIGRLGGPGLIPVSFVDIKDTTTGLSVTDSLEAVRKAGVPKVEEWKRVAAEYKNSSITLGRLDQADTQLSSAMDRASIQQGRTPPPTTAATATTAVPQQQVSLFECESDQPTNILQPRPIQTQPEVPLAPLSASVPRYCFDNDMYWYIIECKMEDGRWWELSRYYADFYDFQIALLEAFPEEAGNRGKQRTLPFMPGPVAHVTDAISNGRRLNLDEYIKKIVAMPPHISKCLLIRNLFKPKPGQDFEIDPNALGEDYRLSGQSQHSLQQTRSNTTSRQSDGSQPTPNSAYGSVPLPNGNRGPNSRAPHSFSADGINGRPPLLHTQASTLTQGSATSSIKQSGGGGGGGGSNNTKIKVLFENDIIVIRVPQDISFQALKEKLMDRLKVNEDIKLQYKDEATNQLVEMHTDDHLDHAMAVNSKLTLHVTYASD